MTSDMATVSRYDGKSRASHHCCIKRTIIDIQLARLSAPIYDHDRLTGEIRWLDDPDVDDGWSDD